MDSITPSVTPESDHPSPVAEIVRNPNPPPVEETNVEEGFVEDMTSEDDGAVDSGEDFNERKVLPEELSKNVMLLSCDSTAEGGSCDVYLVGTAHVSQESCKEVRDVIDYIKPEVLPFKNLTNRFISRWTITKVVFLELCPSRVAVLTPQSLKVPTMGQMVDMWKKKQNAFGILYCWCLAKIATKLEVFPGAEFRVAYDEAIKYGSKVILGDRPVQITLRRTWGKMPLWHKTKLLFSLFFEGLFLPSAKVINEILKEMDDTDMLTLLIQEMSKEFPSLSETLIDERDKYMSFTLQEVASEHRLVIAVVGKGHLQGIKKNWKQPIEMNELLQVPQAKKTVSVVKIIASLGVAVAGVAILSGIFLSSKK